jgi:A nuclease family of the HNH/ENDO VII superfamily with conserved AHH
MNKHHLIPKSLESHPVLIFLRANGGFDIDRTDNLLMLPSESKAAQAVGAALDVGLR